MVITQEHQPTQQGSVQEMTEITRPPIYTPQIDDNYKPAGEHQRALARHESAKSTADDRALVEKVVIRALHQSTNYTADEECFPQSVTFANGRCVTIHTAADGYPYLEVEVERDAEGRKADIAANVCRGISAVEGRSQSHAAQEVVEKVALAMLNRGRMQDGHPTVASFDGFDDETTVFWRENAQAALSAVQSHTAAQNEKLREIKAALEYEQLDAWIEVGDGKYEYRGLPGYGLDKALATIEQLIKGERS